MVEAIQDALAQLGGFDRFIILANVFLLIFAEPLARRLTGVATDARRHNRIIVLRVLSVALLAMYLLSMVTDLGTDMCPSDDPNCDVLRRLSLSGLTIVVSYLVYIAGHAWIVRRYGKTREIEDQRVLSPSYQSEILSVIFLCTVVVFVLLTVFSIWGLKDWLDRTSVLGALALILFFTKDVWLPDNINGLILLYNSDVEPGTVVRVPELDLFAVTLRTSLVQTVFRDLVQQHLIVVPNAKLRGAKIEVLSKAGASGLKDYVDFNIGYQVQGERVEELLTRVWELACNLEAAINPDSPPKIRLSENGDHAITWRLFYCVGNVYRLLPARYAINRAAHEVSTETGIGLNTPLTHTVLPPDAEASSAAHRPERGG